LLALLFVTGLTIAPGLIMQSALIDRMVPAHRLSEGQGWLNTAFSSGGALGTSIAGPVLDGAGPGYGFLGAAAAVLGAMLLAVAVQPLLRRSPAPAMGPAPQPSSAAESRARTASSRPAEALSTMSSTSAKASRSS